MSADVAAIREHEFLRFDMDQAVQVASQSAHTWVTSWTRVSLSLIRFGL